MYLCLTIHRYSCCFDVDPSFHRPIAGFVNFCPQSLAGSDIDDDFVLAVAKHEILHALVSERILCLLSFDNVAKYAYEVTVIMALLSVCPC